MRSQTVEAYQVDKASIQRFTASMEKQREQKFILNGEQDPALIKALGEIGVTIEFQRSSDCTIC